MRGGLSVLAVLGALVVAGCATLTMDWQSVETVGLSPQAAATVADDLARMMTQRYGPAQTPLVMPHPDRPLGQALEQSLRRAGYAVHTAGAATGVRVAYVVDGFAPDQVLVRLRVGPDYRLARLYTM
jgi:hypothetical protein